MNIYIKLNKILKKDIKISFLRIAQGLSIRMNFISNQSKKIMEKIEKITQKN